MAYYTAGLVGSYFRDAVAPVGFDISRSTVRAVNLLTSGTIRDTAGTLDISGGNIYISGTLTQSGGAVASDGFVVAVGSGTNSIAYSSNGSNWTGVGSSVFTVNGRGVAWNGSLWVAVGSGTNVIAYSSNGSNWTVVGSSVFTFRGNGVAWNGSLWAAAGEGTNSLAYSSNGSNWTGAGTSVFSTRGNGVAWNGSLWVAAGEGTNSLAYSSDGSNWTGVGTSIFSTAGTTVAWNGSLWVAVGSGTNSLAYSSDGSNWTGLGTSTFSTAAGGIAWNGSLWVAVGSGTNTIAYSSDGSNWTGVGTSTFSTSGFGVSWNGSVWVATGSGTSSLAYSSDGSNWTGLGTSIFSVIGLDVASRRYVLPVIKSVTYDASGGSVYYTGSLVGTNAAASNQIGGVTLRNSNAIIGGYIRNALTPSQFDISGGNIYISGTLTQGGSSTSNLIVPGYIRNALTPTTLDISGGNISNSGTTQSTNAIITGCLRDGQTPVLWDISGGNIRNIGTTTSLGIDSLNVLVSGYLRNNINASQLDISGGNIRNTGTTSSANALVSGYIRNALTATQFDISGGNISNSGTTRSSNFIGTSAASNSIGGVTLSNTNLTLAGIITGSTANTSNVIGGVTLSNTNLTLPGIITGSIANTSNVIGGVTLSNTNISNAGTHTSGNFIGTTTASNSIGGVTLSNSNIELYGGITGLTANTANTIGGITLSNNTISNVGDITTFGTLGFTSADTDKLYWTTAGVAGPKVAHTAGWSVDMYAGSNGADTGTFRFLRGATTGGGSAESLRITTQARVGVNCNSPLNQLDICASGTFDGIRITAANPVINMYVRGSEANGNTMQFYANSSSGGLHQFDSARSMNFLLNSTSRMAIGSNGNVAIGPGFSNPAYALDVCSSSAQATAVFRNSSSNQAGVWATSGSGVAYSAGIELYHDPSGTATQGLYTANSTPMTFWTANARRMTILSNGNVGVGTTGPAYALDVSTAVATTAAVNIATWPRMNTTSNFFWVRGHCNATVSTYRVRWNTTNSNVPNTNIMTWTDNATHGSYFQILKSGIWSINFLVQASGAGFSWVDASSSFSNGYALPITAGAGDMIAIGPATGNTYVTSFTGYLPSNSGKFYRFSSTNANTNGGTGVIAPYLTIALLYETPDIVPTFFSP